MCLQIILNKDSESKDRPLSLTIECQSRYILLQETRVSYSPERLFFRPYPINEDIFRQGGLGIFDTAESVHHLLVLKMARQLLQATSWGEKATHSWDKATVRPFCFSAYGTLFKMKSVFSAIWGDPCHKS